MIINNNESFDYDLVGDESVVNSNSGSVCKFELGTK